MQIPIDFESNTSHAQSAIIALQQWYNATTGLWETTGWWNSANALTMLADFVTVDPSLDVAAKHVFRNTFPQAQKASLATVKVMTPYKGAIESGLFLTVAAQLANRASNREYSLE